MLTEFIDNVNNHVVLKNYREENLFGKNLDIR